MLAGELSWRKNKGQVRKRELLLEFAEVKQPPLVIFFAAA
jgi:hypothetical protein